MERKFFKYFSKCGFKEKLDRVIGYLEENGEDGVSMHTFVPDSAGINAPYEFFEMYGRPISEEKKGLYESLQEDIYADLDAFMDEINEELNAILEEEGIKKEYPFVNFVVGWNDGEIALTIYPIS